MAKTQLLSLDLACSSQSKQKLAKLLLIATVGVLTLTKYNGYKLYIHNLSGFDGIFLFKYLIALKAEGYQVTFLKRDDNFIKISILKKGDNPKDRDKFNLTIFCYLLSSPALTPRVPACLMALWREATSGGKSYPNS